MKIYQTSPPKHRVTLNGTEVQDFIWADDKAGIVKIFARHTTGEFVYMSEQLIAVELPGTVKIEPTWPAQQYIVTSVARL
jgi:hypothetical protein